jgi:hypothetical protein
MGYVFPDAASAGIMSLSNSDARTNDGGVSIDY